MKLNKKIKAFTLSEMIVVLILTSIVVGLAFMVLTLVQKHMTSIQKNINQSAELHKLESNLWLDFNRYTEISFHNESLYFSSELGSISYVFSNKYIVKGRDSFFIPIESKQFFFKGKATKTTNTIDAIKLETGKTFQNQEIFIFKQNDAATFVN